MIGLPWEWGLKHNDFSNVLSAGEHFIFLHKREWEKLTSSVKFDNDNKMF